MKMKVRKMNVYLINLIKIKPNREMIRNILNNN